MMKGNRAGKLIGSHIFSERAGIIPRYELVTNPKWVLIPKFVLTTVHKKKLINFLMSFSVNAKGFEPLTSTAVT